MLAIIQVRLSSSRFPRKALQKLRGVIVLKHVIEQALRCRNVDNVIVATSEEASDDDLYRECIKLNVACYRGSLKNVASRVSNVVMDNNLSDFVRICGDSPFLSPTLVDYGIEVFHNKSCDLLTNVCPRSFPVGQSVEILKGSVFIDNVENLEVYGEHITQFFYKNSNNFKIVNMKNNSDQSQDSWAVDYPKDIKRLEELLKNEGHWRFTPSDISLQES